MTGDIRLVVALETSARPSSIAVARGSGAAIGRRLTEDRSHASDILVELAGLAAEVGCDRSELDLVIVGTGPGSYTGLRVGAATALGLHRGSGAALVGVPSFEAIAWTGLEIGQRGAVIRNAFGGQVYFAVYERTENGLRSIVEPACLQPDAALQSLNRDMILLADDAALGVLGGAQREPGGHSPLDACIRGDVAANAAALLTLGRARFERDGGSDPATVRPLYLRAFEAKVRAR